ncbi:CtsR family transcriptional regulator [Clostridium grantii]|uniref:Transcriptional regulator CtsR n=1 Tax=Clostridium grantii DSM 8605 TaxID=1121316 RepID=A0A1M5XPB4_9CLOT|nr:CtsR family transcriptional regulator [Clostridium grantii]SHI01641.1 transcriptional regulator CtsR [Clostridium grantii DSM 8605]
MARLSDIIEVFIKTMIEKDDNNNSVIEIKRNELANQFSCAPSQINYVLTTRFSSDKGYHVESKRGGGGYIKISKIQYEKDGPLMEVIKEKIGNRITYNSSKKIIDSLFENGIITEKEGYIMKSAINDRCLTLFIGDINEIRAKILKSMIATGVFR